jgi:hypothetical protein
VGMKLMKLISKQYWHIASFTERFRKSGDYLTIEMFGWPFFLIKDKDGNIVGPLSHMKFGIKWLTGLSECFPQCLPP